MFSLDQPVQSLMKTTMENIKNMIDVNTVVGDAVETKDGTVIVPVSKVSFAFIAGGGEYTGTTDKNEEDASKYPFAGGSGAGVTVQPIGFLATTNGQLRVIPVRYSSAVDRIVDMVPDLINNMENYLKKKRHSEEDSLEM
ncbi:MAG TPA: GerW family sporulation protein [Bacillota bacterium]|nr:GerW family sporulation protein [Bacillota bacterium]